MQAQSLAVPIYDFSPFDFFRQWPAEAYAASHDAWNCRGNCPRHPLLVGDALAVQLSVAGGLSWGALVQRDEDMALEAMSAAERSMVEDALLAREKAEAAERGLTLEASRMFNYAEGQKLLNTRGKGNARHIAKVQEPCKFLFCDERAPKGTWTTNAKGEKCAPVRKGLTGSECWAHEYHHPKSGAHIKPHTCKRLHPGEPGWLPEWNTDRTFRPAPAADFLVARGLGPRGQKVPETSGW
jgi:hypothetical protein